MILDLLTITITAMLGYLTGRRRHTVALDADHLELAQATAQVRTEREEIAAEWLNVIDARIDMQRTCRAMLEEAGIEGQLS